MEQELKFSNTLKTQILKKISPSKEELKILHKLTQNFISKINTLKEKNSFNFDVQMGGSYAKNTHLKGNFDVDLFFIFSPVVQDGEKQKQLEQTLQQIGVEYSLQRGSRIYFSGIYKEEGVGEFKFECVPTQTFEDISQIINSTDVSIFHVNNFQSEVSKNPQLPDEVRLAKQWCKSKKLYGAESYIQGFSGHSIECLLIQLQTFENFILFLCTMEYGQILYFNKQKYEMSKDKLSALIIQDPIIPTRNASSALSDNIFYRAKFEAIKQLKSSISQTDFEIKSFKNYDEFYAEFIKNYISNTLIIELSFSDLNTSDETIDSIGSKSLRSLKKFTSYVSSLGFEILNTKFEFSEQFSKILYCIEFESLDISKYYYKKGPSLDLNSSIINSFLFANSHKHIIIKKSYLHTLELREVNSITQLINTFSNSTLFTNTFFIKPIKTLNSIALRLLK